MVAYDFQLLLKCLLEHGVAWAPDQEVVYRDQVRYTYADMYARVLRLASALQRLGVKGGTGVGVMEWDSHRYLEMYFAIPGMGAVLHTINPRLSVENLIYTLAHAEDEVLIFHEDFLALVEQLRPHLPSIRKYILLSDGGAKPGIKADAEYEELLGAAPPLDELPDLDENTQATLSYTTGTTGKPKGGYFTHRQLLLHTGDVANVDEYGYIQIVDRTKDVIKSGGEWIVSLELENLLSLHDDVLEAAVIGVPDEFISAGALPRTSVGKINKKVLREEHGQGR